MILPRNLLKVIRRTAHGERDFALLGDEIRVKELFLPHREVS